MRTYDHSAAWRKAKASGSTDCVEMAPLPDGTVGIANSKSRDGMLSVSAAAVADLIAGAKAGEFDSLAG